MTPLHHHLLLEGIISKRVTMNWRKSLVLPVGLIIVITKCRLLISIPILWRSWVKPLILWVARVTIIWMVVPLWVIEGHIVEPVLWGTPISLFSGKRGFSVVSWIPWKRGLSIIPRIPWKRGLSVIPRIPWKRRFPVISRIPWKRGFSVVFWPSWHWGFSIIP